MLVSWSAKMCCDLLLAVNTHELRLYLMARLWKPQVPCYAIFLVLDYIYAFYQENMSAHEVESAIHTDSRHADRL
ncbi:hypothetical protein QYF36_015968 [Acer negundo]|nr:hypothetical protein QYF36_015968 [Acer negundo]